MLDLTHNLVEQIAIYNSPTLTKVFIEQHGYDVSLLARLIKHTKWTVVATGMKEKVYRKLYTNGYRVGGNWIEDFFSYGDLDLVTLAIKKLPNLLKLLGVPQQCLPCNEALNEKPYLLAFMCSYKRLPYHAFDPYKDTIKSEWRSITNNTLVRELIVYTSKPTFEWLFYNIFSRDDGIELSSIQSSGKIFRKRFIKLLKYGDFLRNGLNKVRLMINHNMYRQAKICCDKLDPTIHPITYGGDYINIRTETDYSKSMDLINEMSQRMGTSRYVILNNFDEICYRRLDCVAYGISEYRCVATVTRLYTKYTKDTIEYIVNNPKFQDAVIRSALFLPFKDVVHVVKMYRDYGLKIVPNVCMKYYHDAEKFIELSNSPSSFKRRTLEKIHDEFMDYLRRGFIPTNPYEAFIFTTLMKDKAINKYSKLRMTHAYCFTRAKYVTIKPRDGYRGLKSIYIYKSA